MKGFILQKIIKWKQTIYYRSILTALKKNYLLSIFNDWQIQNTRLQIIF